MLLGECYAVKRSFDPLSAIQNRPRSMAVCKPFVLTSFWRQAILPDEHCYRSREQH